MSLPKLRPIFRPNSEIQTFEGGCFPMGGLFSIFHTKSASKAPKTCDFAYFTSQWGGSSPPRPPGYATGWSRGPKARGQGQSFRGRTLSRPRTGMLEAKDQGHKHKCSPKRKGLHKNFSGDLQKKKISSNLHKKTFSKKFFNRSTKF